jgi:hypothetical protein
MEADHRLFHPEEVPGPRRRALLYAAAGAVLGVYIMLGYRYGKPLGGSDFDQVWAAARAVLQGVEPYGLIGPGDPAGFPYPLFYPLSAIFAGLPFTVFSFQGARLAFVAAGGGLLGYAMGRYRPWLWPTFLGTPFLLVGRNAQWSALVTAAMILPWLGPLVAVAKPNLGVAMLAGARTRRALKILLIGSAVLLALSLVIQPDWPWRWREALQASQHFHPLILRPGGFVMLLALLRWWDPDARLLLALAAVPQTGLFYDVLPACLVARTRLQAIVIALATQLAGVLATAAAPVETFTEVSWRTGMLVLWGGLGPPLMIVILRGVGLRPPSEAPRAPVAGM